MLWIRLEVLWRRLKDWGIVLGGIAPDQIFLLRCWIQILRENVRMCIQQPSWLGTTKTWMC